MTFKKAVRAINAALLYFFIYLGWNFAVTFAVSYAVCFDVLMKMDTAALFGVASIDYANMTPEMLSAMMLELSEQMLPVYMDFVSKYAVHITVASSFLALLTYIFIFAIRKKSFTDKIGLRKIRFVSGVAMVLFGVCLNVFVSTLLSVIPLPEAWVAGYTDAADLLVGQTGILVTVMVGVIVPILEEIVFRGMCYNSLKSGIPMLAAMILSSWGFGMMHVEILWVLYATVMGLVLVWTYEKHGSILAPIFAHMGFNLTGQMLNLLPEVPNGVYIAMMAVSGLACAAIAVYVMRTSKYKIEYVMPEAVTEHNESENDNNEGER